MGEAAGDPSLRLLDLTLSTPEENLALDEALLAAGDEALGRGTPPRDVEILRLWESPVTFVVLGVACRLGEDVDQKACARDGVPVLRRASGGGTVLQGPGCLNFSLILALEPRPELAGVSGSYAFILRRTASSLARPAGGGHGGDGGGIEHRGTSDLAAGDLKFSGNAQKRARRALLHHGTVLHGLDLSLLPRYLREPRKEPEYRRHRSHQAFVANLDLRAEEVRERLARGWNAVPGPPGALPDLGPFLAKHRSREWIERF
jgi:lipoate-protein ligase A